MADRIVWFHGPSGAGKCTLVNQIEIDSGHPVRHRLSLADVLLLCREGFAKDTQTRDSLADTLARHHRPGTDLLVKGQSSDIWDWDPRRDLTLAVASRLPHCTQEIVFVWADPGDLRRRCNSRPNPEGYNWNSHNFDLECRLLIQWVSALGLPTTCVKNSDEGGLAIGEHPAAWPA
jgi:hypothetical protein